MRTARTLRGALIAGAVAALAVTPAFAQTPEAPSGDDDQVACDPADPDPGADTTCTAEGLKAETVYDWTATFADGTEKAGTGASDSEGTSEFTVTVPEGEEAEGDYTVTVTGTDEDDSEYEATHEGTVGGSSNPLSDIVPAQDPSEEPSEEDSEEPSDEPTEDGDDSTAPGNDSGQVNPAPSGAVATGAGGTADTDSAPLSIVIGLSIIALAAGVWLGQRVNPTTDA